MEQVQNKLTTQAKDKDMRMDNNVNINKVINLDTNENIIIQKGRNIYSDVERAKYICGRNVNQINASYG